MRGKKENDLAHKQGIKDADAEKVKGRSNDLIRRRNERLIARLYYYRVFTEKRYEIVLEHLGKEFDLSTVTIPQIARTAEWLNEYQRIKQLQPSLGYFKRRWPWMEW